MTRERLQLLFDRHIYGLNTPEEDDELMLYLANPQWKEDTVILLNQLILSANNNKDMSDERAGAVLDEILSTGSKHRKHVYTLNFITRKWVRYAAAIILVLTGAAIYYFSFNTAKDTQPQTIATVTADSVQPGSDRAILTLADGRRIELDNSTTETIHDGALSIENNNGRLIYKDQGAVTMNIMTTPCGGQYQLTLADGTQVWLNAESSISYPTKFAGHSREVTITGEAYFNVAHNPRQPFLVNTQSGQQVEVLGTQFNINAYADEEHFTAALVEGAINVKTKDAVRKLHPGQIAEVVKTKGMEEITMVSNVSLESVTAWKNGVFNFNNKTLKSIMRQLSRWYDIEIVYAGKIPDKQFWGEMGMDVKLEDVLEFLEKSNVKFTYQKGRKLIVGQ